MESNTTPTPTYYRVSWTEERKGNATRKTKIVTGEKAYDKLMKQIDDRDGYNVETEYADR